MYVAPPLAWYGHAHAQQLLTCRALTALADVPESLPLIAADELRTWATMSMAQVCARVMHRFVDLPLDELDQLTATAFRTFNGGCEPPLPLVRVGDKTFLETGNGPTLAFKDVGQQVVARLLNIYLGKSGRHANIIVETSGDTGPAAIAGVAGCEHADIFCLYPCGRVTDVQELQMITASASNVHVFRTEGDTDEQAEALKLLFSDGAFMARHDVCSINSINWARVMTQSAYYFWACLQVRPNMDGSVHFVVPTGAFGNAVGGLIAKLMGAPVGRIVCATNANDVVHRTISHGDLSIAPNVPTISPAMDIQFACAPPPRPDSLRRSHSAAQPRGAAPSLSLSLLVPCVRRQRRAPPLFHQWRRYRCDRSLHERRSGSPSRASSGNTPPSCAPDLHLRCGQ